MLKKINKIVLLFVSVSLFSCYSIKQPKEIFEIPDYTEVDVKKNEIRQISDLKEKTPVKAYWRSILLGDEAIIQECEENLISLLEKAYDEKDYSVCLKYFNSLKTCSADSVKKLSEKGITERTLKTNFYTDVPGINIDAENRALLPKTMAECVNATVTIWVDKGIKIQNGAGYADRVIGSGFFIDKRGYIVTNNHVISDVVDPKNEKFTRLFIKLNEDEETRIPARVVGYDELLDLALLKTEITPPFILELGSSENLEIGQKVSCIGTPLGLHGTVTTGIVSNVDRKLFTTGSVLQIDAAVNSGNSGGPCIDSNNRVQAIVFAGIMQYQGLNFAIPVEYLRQDLPFLYSGGKRKHVWIGGFGHTMKEGLKSTGLEIQYVMPGGVASRALLNSGDIVTFVGERRINTIEDMQDFFRSYTSENIVKIKYLRDFEQQQAFVYLDERPKQPGYEIYKHDLINSSFIPIFGMGLTSASSIYSKKFVIDKIINGSIADESGFSVGDPVHILEVKFNEEKSAVSVGISTRRRKKGYLDVTIGIGATLDGPYYF